MLFCIKQYLVLRSKCRETDWVITCYKWPASATLETPSGLLTGETSRVVLEVGNSWNWQLSTLWMVTLTCISSLSSSRVGGLLVKSPQSSSWILKQKHHLAKQIEFLRPRCGGGRGRRAVGPWSPPVKGADSFLQIQRGCCVHATCWHAELHRFKAESTSHAGSGGRLHQMRIPLDE